MAVLSGLKPEKVFDYFEKLCSVPHGSGNTKIISDMCVGFARELGLRYRQEPCNNVIIWKDASAGYEDSAPIILQGHIDMVCAKTDDCTKDMSVEGLDLVTDSEWVWADKTSMGGDNGIAVAMILAILADDTLAHPPIEAVFTVDEEVGMDGAFALDCSDLKGNKLLNLDSEIEGVFTVSCAGGMRADCHLPGVMEPVTGMAGYTVTLSGLKGGHSGADIHLGRASGNQVMGRVLYSGMKRFPDLRLAAVSGGQFDNVICSRCEAAVAIPAGNEKAFEDFIREFDAVLKNEYAGCDDGITLACAGTEVTAAVSAETTDVMLHTLLALPQGVQAMSVDFPGLVQTSLNLGVLRLEEGGPAGSRHCRVCRRYCYRTGQVSRLAVCPPVRVPRHGGGGLSRPDRQGCGGGGYPRWLGVRAADREDPRPGRDFHGAGAARCAFRPGAAQCAVHRADVCAAVRGAQAQQIGYGIVSSGEAVRRTRFAASPPFCCNYARMPS